MFMEIWFWILNENLVCITDVILVNECIKLPTLQIILNCIEVDLQLSFWIFCMSHDKGLNIIIMEFHRHWTRCTTNSQVFDAFLNPNNMLEKLTQWGESPHSLICTVLLFQNEEILQKEAMIVLLLVKMQGLKYRLMLKMN